MHRFYNFKIGRDMVTVVIFWREIKIDKITIGLVESFDEAGLMKALEKGISEACGGGPIVAAMVASKNEGANNAKVLYYKNSGDVTGDHSAVVGYLSAAFSKLN